MARYLKKGLTALFATMLISSNVSTVSALELTTLERTFNYNNLENTVDFRLNTSDINSNTNIYMITKDNKLRAIGPSIYGSTVTNTQGIWVDIVDTQTGLPLENIVSVKSNSSCVYALSNLGECYYISVEGVKKLETPEKIAKVELSTNTSTYPIFIGESGNLYYSNDFKAIECNGVKFKEVSLSTGSSSGGMTDNLLLSEEGNLYTLDKANYTTVTKLTMNKNLQYKQIAFTSIVGRFLILDITGDLYYVSANSVKPLSTCFLIHVPIIQNNKLLKGDKLITSKYGANSVITNVLCGDTAINIVFKYGPIKEDCVVDNLYKKEMVSRFYVLGDYTSGSNSYIELVRQDDGLVKALGLATAKTFNMAYNYNSLTGITKDWMNNANVIPDKDLSSFTVTTDQIFKRENTLDIDFSLINKTVPKAFNMYFSQALLAGNRDNWVEIEKGVEASKLLINEVDTGYVNGDGSTVNKQNYKYSWELPKRNLVDIQVIIEPVY